MTRWWTRKVKRGWRPAPEGSLRDILEACHKARPAVVTAVRGDLPANGPMLYWFHPVTAGDPAAWRL
jgi:hypothetical protein